MPLVRRRVTDHMLLGLNTLLQGFPTTDAWAMCTFAYSAGPGSEPILFEGRVKGRIVPARGAEKFGWNPIFEVEDTGKTCVLLHFPLISCGSWLL